MTKLLSSIALCLCFTLLATPTAGAQETPSFSTIESCVALQQGLGEVNEESKKLDAVLAQPNQGREQFLAGIFQGTQIMLAYGESMFQLSDQHEERCKAALREAGRAVELAKLYELSLEPTARGYAFLLRVKAVAVALDDEQTAADMQVALEAYKQSAIGLVDSCKQELEPAETSACDALRRNFDLQMP